MGTERAVTVSARKIHKRARSLELRKALQERAAAAGPSKRDEQERRMRVCEGHTVLNLLRAGEDAAWVVAMIVIGFTTFVVSSIFVKGARLQSMCGFQQS